MQYAMYCTITTKKHRTITIFLFLYYSEGRRIPFYDGTCIFVVLAVRYFIAITARNKK